MSRNVDTAVLLTSVITALAKQMTPEQLNAASAEVMDLASSPTASPSERKLLTLMAESLTMYVADEHNTPPTLDASVE